MGLLALVMEALTTADPTPPGFDLGSALTIYGPLGAFVVFLAWFARLAYRREADRSDRLEAEMTRVVQERSQDFVRREMYDHVVERLDRVEISMREQILPALQAATTATATAMQALDAVRREQEVQARVARLHERSGGDS